MSPEHRPLTKTASPRSPSSFGLVGLRERAYLLGGSVDVSSEPGKGTTVELRIPTESMKAPG